MPREWTKTKFTYHFFIPPDEYGDTLIKALKKIETFQLYNLWYTDTTETVHVAIESSLSYHLKRYYEKACIKLKHLLKSQIKQKNNKEMLKKGVKSTGNDQIVTKLPVICANCIKLSAKSIRQFFATKYVQQTVEDQLLGFAVGPNPLNHQDLFMTISKYAKHDAANRDDAWKRLVEKSTKNTDLAKLLETKGFKAWALTGVESIYEKFKTIQAKEKKAQGKVKEETGQKGGDISRIKKEEVPRE